MLVLIESGDSLSLSMNIDGQYLLSGIREFLFTKFRENA